MESRYAKLFAVFAVSLMVLSATIPLLVCDDSDAETPSCYSILESHPELLTDVRSQKTEGLCWAFATSATLETELLSKGWISRDQYLSPLFTSVQQCDGYEKDYRGGDYNALYNEGNMNAMSGWDYHIIEILSNWKGPVEEYLAPYDEFFSNYYSVDRSLGSLVLVKGMKVVDPNIDAGVKEIKRMITENHGAVFIYEASNAVKSASGRLAYYTPITEGSQINHAVELVGWDDNYDKSNFTNKYGTPTSNGAWLVKNSWGTGDRYGDGYAWISYECSISSALFFTDVEMNYGNQNLYSYDHGYSFTSDLYRSGSATMCNVFTSERNENLTGVSMTYFGSRWNLAPEVFDQKYVVKVYKLGDGFENPTDGELLYTSDSGVANNCGTVHVKFNNAVPLKQGDRFSVCVELTGNKICLPVDTTENDYDFGISHTVANAGQSYYLSENGNWTDLSADGKSNFRIKAYTVSEPSTGKVTITHNGQVTSYSSLQEAIGKVQKDDIVTLHCSISESIKIESRPFFVIDLNGFAISSEGDVVTVKNSDVWLTQGKLRCTDGKGSAIVTDNAKIDLSRVYLDSAKNSLTATNGSDVKTHYCTFNNSGGATIYVVSGSNVLVEKQYLTSSNINYNLCDCDVANELVLNEGDFYGTVKNQYPKLVAGTTFFNEQWEGQVAEGSSFIAFNGRMMAGVSIVEFTNMQGEAGKKTFNLSYAYYLMKPGTTLTLLSDVFLWDPVVLHDASKVMPVTIDLNGHNITTARHFLELYSEVTLTNSSSKRSTIDCASIGYIGKLHIDKNIDVVESRYAAYQVAQGEVVVDVSGLSTIRYINDRGTSLETTVPYSKDGKYCELVTTVKYEEDRATVKSNTVEERTYSELHQLGNKKFTAVSKTTYADGTTETSVNDGSGITVCTSEDGSVSAQGIIVIDSISISLCLSKEGYSFISATISAPYGGTVTEDNVKAAVEKVIAIKDRDDVKQIGCKDIELKVLLTSTSGYEHTFDKAAVEFLAKNHVSLDIRYQSYDDIEVNSIHIPYEVNSIHIPYEVLEGIHGELSVDFGPMNGIVASDKVTKVIDGKKLAYTATVKVDGKKLTGKLSQNISFRMSMPVVDHELKAYKVTEDGKFVQLESMFRNINEGNFIIFETDCLGTFVLCDGLDSDDEEIKPTQNNDINGGLIAVIVIAAIVACVFVFLIFRLRH